MSRYLYNSLWIPLDIAREAGGSIHYAWFPSGTYFNRGNEQACLGMHVDAIADYRRAADAAPLYKSTHFNCGNAYFMQQRYADAVACYDQVRHSQRLQSRSSHLRNNC